jgi:hypothetical protein
MEREQTKGLQKSSHTRMFSNLQKRCVREIEGVQPGVISISNMILAQSGKKPATSDNLLQVYPRAKNILKVGCCKVLKAPVSTTAAGATQLVRRRPKRDTETEKTAKPNTRPSEAV